MITSLQNSGEKQKSEASYRRHEYAVLFDESIQGKNNLEIIRFLKEKTSLFKEIPQSFIDQLGPYSKIEKFPKGAQILKEGDSNTRIYFLMKGSVGIYKEGDHVLSLRRKGDIFGEMSLISHKPGWATVVAEQETDVFSIQVEKIGSESGIDEAMIRESLYRLYAVVLADKLEMTTHRAIGFEKKIAERTIELRKTNQNLIAAKARAEEASLAKSEFLSNMSHELRTPIHHILSYAQIGIRYINEKKDKTLECLHTITSSGAAMMALITNLLDLSRLETGKIAYEMEKNDLSMILLEEVTNANQQPDREKRKILFEYRDDLPNVQCDRRMVVQVIKNLLSNAIKFSGEEKQILVQVQTDKAASDQEEKALVVSVQDDGVGIPEDELDRIFDRFAESSRTKTGAGGTGLGLAICQKVINDHQGKIWAENNPEGGATFSFTLPVYKEDKK